MPSTDVNPRDFVFEYRTEDLAQGNARVSICYIQYPEENASGVTVLPDDVGSGRLGDISLEVRLTSNDLRLSGEELTSPIENTLRVRVKQPDSDGGSFNPCFLDRDGNGVVSRQDIDTLYANIPFVNPRLDINGDGVVNEDDYLLAKEYIGQLCPSEDYFDPQGVYPVLDLDCFTYSQDDSVWEDLSGHEYHFNTEQAANIVPPIKNEDGSITVGLGQILPSDEGSVKRYFIRNNVVDYPEGTDFTDENVAAKTADAAAAYRELFIPDVDQAFSFEFVYKFTPQMIHGADILGLGGPPEGEISQRAKIFGYPNYGQGGFNFGTGYTNPNPANSFICIPYSGMECNVYGGYAPGGGAADNINYDYPNKLPYSLLSGSRYYGFDPRDFSSTLNLDSAFGIPNVPDKLYVTVTFDPYAGEGKGARFYTNGVLMFEDWAKGIGMPAANDDFIIGGNMQGGWSWPDGVDIYCLKIYDKALTQEQVANNYESLLAKYGL
jgi:hypothetical protein